MLNKYANVEKNVKFELPNKQDKDLVDTADQLTRDDPVGDGRVGACVVSYTLFGACVFPLTIVGLLLVGFGFGAALLLSFVLAAPLTVMVVLMLRLISRL